MAERVQMNLERMIPELEDYKKCGIFSPAEVKRIVETRRKHEYRLQKVDRKLLDIVRYIESETTLEKIRDRRIRKKKAGLLTSNNYISKRIVGLYKSALFKYNDPKILNQFVYYAMGRELYEDMKYVFADMCLKHPVDVDLWIFCATKLFEINDFEGSRAMFLKAIRMNPKSSRLRVEFFRTETSYIEAMAALNNDVDEEDKDDIERGEIAFMVFVDYFRVFGENEDFKEIVDISKKVVLLKDRIEKYLRETE